jgi:nucleoid DNA-binding protein
VLSVIQRVLDGIIETLVSQGRIEFRNFGVGERDSSGIFKSTETAQNQPRVQR